mgnify:CR=1 FL=1
MSKRILIIDALNLYYRSYIVDPSISLNGQPIGGLKGFLKSLQKLVRETKPDEVVICWDGEGGSQRRKAQNKNYKEGRKPIRLNRSVKNLSEDQEKENKIWQQLRLVEYLNEMPLIQLLLPHVEADDLIAFTSQFADFKEDQKVIVSSDKDFYQLLNKSTVLIRPIQKVVMNENKIVEDFGIHPNNFALARAICGDKSDNIDGIPGAGLATIAKRFPFLREKKAHTVTDIVEHCEAQEKKLLIHERILENQKKVLDNYRLMQLYLPTMSPQGCQLIKEKLKSKERHFNKTKITAMMFKDGIGEYNWFELWACYNKITWGKQ